MIHWPQMWESFITQVRYWYNTCKKIQCITQVSTRELDIYIATTDVEIYHAGAILVQHLQKKFKYHASVIIHLQYFMWWNKYKSPTPVYFICMLFYVFKWLMCIQHRHINMFNCFIMENTSTIIDSTIKLLWTVTHTKLQSEPVSKKSSVRNCQCKTKIIYLVDGDYKY